MEKEQFIETWQRESPITLKVLKAYPENKADWKPHERARSAKELAWTFVVEGGVIDGAIKGNIDFENMPNPPVSWKEVIQAYERMNQNTVEKVKKMSENDFTGKIKFMVGPNKTADVRRADIFWMMLMDAIHHRGQFSVYLRMAGGKVPSIYGPSADEPWM